MARKSLKLENSLGDERALCTFCEMTVFWVQVELRKQKTKEKVFNYVGEVEFLSLNSTIDFLDHNFLLTLGI